MGIYLFDQYSLLHFASGVIAYFFGINWVVWFLLHSLFEFIENTNMGMIFINNYLTFWPGGKPYPDSFLNNIGDTISAMAGWALAKYFDKVGVEQKWYIN